MTTFNFCRKLKCLLFATGAVVAFLPPGRATAAPAQPAPPTPPAAAAKADDGFMSLEVLARGLYYLESMYVDPEKAERNQMVMLALRGIVDSLDPHTALLPKKAFQQLTIYTQGKFGGLGIIVSQENNKLHVTQVMENTPASRAGIEVGDEIVALDGAKVSEISPSEAVDRMRGAPGTQLKLTVARGKPSKNHTFAITREVIRVASTLHRTLDDGLQYIRVSSFQEETSGEIEKVLIENQKNTTGLILDLRDNPGGLLEQAIRTSDLFIESGLLLSTVGRDRDRIEREYASKRGAHTKFPMAVLVNGGSASASEIVAGALQDHERALIMGTTTFGKGSVQTLVSLPDGSGMKITVARYYTPKNRTIQATGIHPDVVVAASAPPADVPMASNAGAGAPQGPKSEAGLAGHIAAKEIGSTNATPAILNAIQKWPKDLRGDHQLTTAFTYLKSWSRFQQGTKKTEATPSSTPISAPLATPG